MSGQRKRPARLNLIKPSNIDPQVWLALTAARAGQRKKLGGLIEADAGLVDREFWYTRPIHFAVREGHLSAVRLLLDRGTDPTWIRYGHESLTTVARDRGHDQVAELINAARLEHNVDRTLPIHEAAAVGDGEKVAELIAADESHLDAGDGQGWTPLHHAVHGGHYGTVDLLLEHGADVDAVQSGGSDDWYAARGQRPIDLATQADDAMMIGCLMAGNAEYTLDLAALAGDADGVKRLVRSKAGRRAAGGQALTVAARAGDEKLVRLLLEGGVDPRTPTPRTCICEPVQIPAPELKSEPTQI